MKWIILALFFSGCNNRSIDEYQETMYPDTPTMQSAVDAMETK